MNDARDLAFERSVGAPPQAVFEAFTNALALTEWLCNDARSDAVVGGRIYLHWTTGYYSCGEFTDLEPERTIGFTWRGRGEPGSTQVTIELRGDGDATTVRLRHEGLGAGDEWDEAADWFGLGWDRSLENLASVLEEGIDLRQYERPMMGIAGGDEVTPELAAEEDLPTVAGVRLAELVDGMGAKSAGLRPGDIVVRIGDTGVDGWESLGEALNVNEVGDVVAVELYRGAAKTTLEMELTARPRPEPPPPPETLADNLRAVHSGLDAELNQLLDGVTDEEADVVPEWGGWSVRQVLAHLITTEQAAQLWLARLVSGQRLDYWASNEESWVSAVDESYETVADLVAELRHCQAQTAAQVSLVPVSFVARKGSYMQVADLLLEGLPVHTRLHYTQMVRVLGREA